jgi:Ni,Fe-hydrogenase III small subunit
MPIREFNIFRRHKQQYIPDLRAVELTPLFRGRPLIAKEITLEESERIISLCPTGAIHSAPARIDLGKCVFCKECEFALPDKIRFSNDYKIASNSREGLIVSAGDDTPIRLDPERIRKEIRSYFKHALKLRQVSAGGDNSAEMELNAAGNVNFDMGRYGIEFVASPRHADGIVITGPISENMSEALRICYDAIPEPKLIILCGTDAISGGIFAESPTLNRSFLGKFHADLFIPGNPPHPLTFILGILDLIGRK